MVHLSIVTSLYKSSPYVKEFYERISASIERLGVTAEIVFVNDGSPDDALEICIQLAEADPRISVVDLSKNFGHHKAIYAGINYAKGDFVFLIDVDLEEPPELLEDLYLKLEKTDGDVVYGVQRIRKGAIFERVSGALFYYFFNMLSEQDIPRNLSTVRIITRRYVNSLVEHGERAMFLPGLFATTGYKQTAFPFKKLGKDLTAYNTLRKISMAVDAVTAFSARPLVIVFVLGTLISLLSFVVGVGLFVASFFVQFNLAWPSLMISIWMLGGFTILSIGILGMYISKVVVEVKQRPNYIVKNVYNCKTSPTREIDSYASIK